MRLYLRAIFQLQAPRGLLFGGAYIRRGLFSEFYSIDLARAKSEALFNIYSFLKENAIDKVKTTRTVKNNNNRSNKQKTNFARAAHFFPY